MDCARMKSERSFLTISKQFSLQAWVRIVLNEGGLEHYLGVLGDEKKALGYGIVILLLMKYGGIMILV